MGDIIAPAAIAPAAPAPLATLVTATISAGQSLSTGVDCSVGGALSRIYMPTGWDGELLTFQVSPDGVNFYDLFRANNTEVAFNITAGTVVFITENYPLVSNNWIKLRSGSRLNPRIQSADRIFTLSFI